MNKFAKAIAAIMLIVATIIAAGCTKPDEPNNGGNNNGQNDTIVNDDLLNGHEYVDLGLPSGTLWAICNVGAETAEELGDYYAWGETQTKGTYSWGFYWFCANDYNQLTKYCSNSNFGYNGFMDNLQSLLLCDDVANSNWGSGWRIPTKTQWEELCQNTTQIWMAKNGINGRLFTAPNGNSLFLPAAGGYNGSDTYGVGYSGNYWSSLLDTDYPDNAWFLIFFADDYGINSHSRCIGRSIRPVCTVK